MPKKKRKKKPKKTRDWLAVAAWFKRIYKSKNKRKEKSKKLARKKVNPNE